MKLIVISNPVNFEQEQAVLLGLFECGLEYFHLRKPGFSKDEMEKYLRLVHKDFHDKIILHSHFELINKYELKGLHYNFNSLDLAPVDKSGHESFSFHALEEIEKCNRKYDYVFLSPVFDSISKKNYKRNFDLAVLEKYIKNRNFNFQEIIALGGIDENKVEKARTLGFSGVAVLGSIWGTFLESGNVNQTVEKFNLIRDKCQLPVLMY